MPTMITVFVDGDKVHAVAYRGATTQVYSTTTVYDPEGFVKWLGDGRWSNIMPNTWATANRQILDNVDSTKAASDIVVLFERYIDRRNELLDITARLRGVNPEQPSESLTQELNEIARLIEEWLEEDP